MILTVTGRMDEDVHSALGGTWDCDRVRWWIVPYRCDDAGRATVANPPEIARDAAGLRPVRARAGCGVGGARHRSARRVSLAAGPRPPGSCGSHRSLSAIPRPI